MTSRTESPPGKNDRAWRGSRVPLLLALASGVAVGHLFLVSLPPIQLVAQEFDIQSENSADPPDTAVARDDGVDVERSGDATGGVDHDAGEPASAQSHVPSEDAADQPDRKLDRAELTRAPLPVHELLTGRAVSSSLLRNHHMLPPPVRSGASVHLTEHETQHAVSNWEQIIRRQARITRRLGTAPWEGASFEMFGSVGEEYSLVVSGRGGGIPASAAATVRWFQRANDLVGTPERIQDAEKLVREYGEHFLSQTSELVHQALASSRRKPLQSTPGSYLVRDGEIYVFDAKELPELEQAWARHSQRLDEAREAVFEVVR